MKKSPILILAVILCGCGDPRVANEKPAPVSASEATYELLLPSEIEWTALNPARGEKGPRAGTLWGNRSGLVPTGFLVKFVDGFSSPPHIHNVTYRGAVVSGLVHNDDPDAADMWMPTGSFWTQPAGEVHITSAKGENNVAYIEIEKGPYLVLPVEEANDNGERPVNIHRSNIVWLDGSNSTWIDISDSGSPADGPKISHLWGDPVNRGINGSMIKLPPGYSGEIRCSSPVFRAVVIEGQAQYSNLANTEPETLDPGSYFGSKGKAVHAIECGQSEGCLVYVRAVGKYQITNRQR